MLAVIMGGGAGTRLRRGEKPLLEICKRPMISYVIAAFRQAGCEVVVAVSPKTPMTQNWCRARGVEICRTKGQGYIGDMVDSVIALDEQGPVFVSVSDIPCVRPETIADIREAYRSREKPACSTWIPVPPGSSCSVEPACRSLIDGTDAYPAGINILRGDLIREPQDEFALLIRDPRLAVNVNTPQDIDLAEQFLCSR